MKSDVKSGCANALAIIAASFLVSLGVSLVRAVVLRDLWAWFVAPTWGLAVPTLAATYGLTLMVAVFQGYKRASAEDRADAKDRPWAAIAEATIAHLVACGAVWTFGFVAAEVSS